MTESTTEHGAETEPVALDKAEAGSDAATAETAVTPGDAEAKAEGTDESGSSEAAGGDWVTPADETPPRKRGRRARRAAAAARAAEADAAADTDGDTAEGDAADGDVDAASDETASTAGTSTATKTRRRGKSTQGAKSGPRAKAGTSAKAGTAAAAADETPKRPLLDGRRLTKVITGLLVVAILLAALLLVQLIKGPGNAGKLESQEDRREAARQQADTDIPKLYSFDYRQIDANVTEQGNLTVGSVHDQIASDTGPALKSLAPKIKAVVQAVSLGSAVIDDSGQDVQVLIFLNQATSSNLLPAPRLDRNRVVATMRLVNGQWKVADIKAL